jgi:hypothetical protein
VQEHPEVNSKQIDGVQPKIVSSELLHPFCQRSKTTDKFEPKPKDEIIKTKIDHSTSGVQKTVTEGVSQLSSWSRFISPVLKKKMNRQSTKNEESTISENLPSVMYSMLSNEVKIMEEIKELQTRENFESNPIDSKKPKTYTQYLRENSSNSNRILNIQNEPNGIIPKPKSRHGNLIKWTMGKRLGFGAYGEVIKARNAENGKIFAVKRLALQKNMNEINKEAINSLKAEINVLRQIEHKNIINYVGSEIIKDHFWIYLDYASEGNLLDVFKEFGPWDENMIRIYTQQILEGLTFLHSKSIVHQDLKWANVLVNSSGEIKLSDFGWARIIERSMSNWDIYKSLKGTVPWMAPEILRQKPSDWRADIWSLGWTIIEMATLDNPWATQKIGNTIEDLFKLWDKYGHPDIPEYFSEPLKDFVEKCFAIDYRKRPLAEDLLNHEFINFL